MPCHRQLPSLLFSAVAATAVMFPLAAGDLFADRPAPSTALATTPLIVERPLTGVGYGRTVREVRQDTPFAMVALTADVLSGTSTQVRAQQPNGAWGPWYDAEALEDEAGEDRRTAPGTPEGPPRGTEPVFVGRTTAVQIAVDRTAPPVLSGPTTPARPHRPGLGYRPASVEQALSGDLKAVLISPPQAPLDISAPEAAALTPGSPPPVISRAQWGANEALVCGKPMYDKRVDAAIVHHTAGSNDYSPADSAGIVRSIFEYHTRTLGWCDIAYNVMVDKFGQVFEGRAGGLDRPVEGAHTGGFNVDTWGVAMLGNFEDVPPTPVQLRTTGRLIGWRLALDRINPLGNVVLTSEGGPCTKVSAGTAVPLPTILAHRDVGRTECPGNAAYAEMPLLRQIAAQFSAPRSLPDTLRGGAIFTKWQTLGGDAGLLGAPQTPETSGDGDARYVTFERGAMYWSPDSGAEPVTGAIYDAWGKLGFERGALGLPTSGEIQEPQWIVQNFQHGTLNFDRLNGTVTRVIDGVALNIPLQPGDNPVQLERFRRIGG